MLGITNINVRFFAYCLADADLCEVSESEFEELGGNISYERNSIFANGVRQICLYTDSYTESK